MEIAIIALVVAAPIALYFVLKVITDEIILKINPDFKRRPSIYIFVIASLFILIGLILLYMGY